MVESRVQGSLPWLPGNFHARLVSENKYKQQLRTMIVHYCHLFFSFFYMLLAVLLLSAVSFVKEMFDPSPDSGNFLHERLAFQPLQK